MSKKELRTPVYYLVVAGLTLLQAGGLSITYCAMSIGSDTGAYDVMLLAIATLLIGLIAIGFVDRLIDEFRDQIGLPERKTGRPVPDAVRNSPIPLPTRSIVPTILIAVFLQIKYIYAVDDETAKSLLDTFLSSVWLLTLESAWLKYMLEKGIVRRVFSEDR